MRENERGFNSIKVLGKGKLEVTMGGKVITIDEKAAPRKKPEVQTKFFFPQGTIESLKPLLKDVFNVNGIERDETYWLDIDDAAQMEPKEAFAKIKKANKKFGGITAETVAHVVLATDARLGEAKAFGDISAEQVKGLESLLASKIAKS